MRGAKRDFLRPAIYFIKEEYQYEEGLGPLDSNEQCKNALIKLYRVILEQKESQEKEELYSKNDELSKKVHSLEMELDKYKRKKEKYSKEFEDLKKAHSDSLKNIILLTNKIEEMKNTISTQKDDIISLQKDNLKLKDKLSSLKKELEKSDNLIKDLKEDNQRLENLSDELIKSKEKLEDENHELEIKLENKKTLFEKMLEKIFG